MQFSVVIPARNSARTLSITIESLLQAERQPDEILVIDGCSDDDTVAIAQRYDVRVILNKKKHVAAARQLGALNAAYEVIAFTDSDCQPAADWLRRIARHFESDPKLDGTGGRILLTKPLNEVQAYSAHVFEAIMNFPETVSLITRKTMQGSLAGANCAYRKEAILSVGGFDDFFTNHAEEIDLFWRLIERRAKLLFDPAIKVEHLRYADTITSLIKANFNYGIASTKLAKRHIGFQIDFKVYKLLIESLICSTNPFCKDAWGKLRTLQLASFIFGKLCSSVLFRTINL